MIEKIENNLNEYVIKCIKIALENEYNRMKEFNEDLSSCRCFIHDEQQDVKIKLKLTIELESVEFIKE